MMQPNPYSNLPAPGSPTRTEAWALIEAARRMAGPALDGDVEGMRAGLRLNWRLWTIFQADLTVDTASVPQEVRENMLSLCQFVDRFTVQHLPNPTAEAINTLVNINRNIASGLLAGIDNAGAAAEGRQDGQAEEQPQPQGGLTSAVSA